MDVSVAIGLVIPNLIILIYLLLKRKNCFWKKRNVPFANPLPIVGNYVEYLLLKKYPGQILQEMCQQFPDEPYFGTYYGTDPALVVQDPELLKLVFTKDFYYFSERETSAYLHKEVVTKSMFFVGGDEWKVLRQNMTPLFSSAKMKSMFYLVQNSAKALEQMLEHETKVSDVIEAKSLLARYTMDTICKSAFGVEARTMEKGNYNSPFRAMATEIFKPTKWNGLKVAIRLMWPGFFYALRLRWFAKVVTDFFGKLLQEVFEARGYKPSNRNDFVDSVLIFKTESHIVGDSLSYAKTGLQKRISLKIDDEFLESQCVLFFAAGFETSSSAMSFTLYELAKNQDAQAKAIEEIDKYLQEQDGKIEYDCIKELPYLDACVQEALRLYPVFGILTREVADDYTFPTGLRLEKGLRIHIPVYHLHRNPKYFPDPEMYKPERFMSDDEDKIKPNTYIPFGEGPKKCIGLRFAKMSVLAGLITILKSYRVELAEDMPTRLELDPKIYVTQSLYGLNIKFMKR